MKNMRRYRVAYRRQPFLKFMFYLHLRLFGWYLYCIYSLRICLIQTFFQSPDTLYATIFCPFFQMCPVVITNCNVNFLHIILIYPYYTLLADFFSLSSFLSQRDFGRCIQGVSALMVQSFIYSVVYHIAIPFFLCSYMDSFYFHLPLKAVLRTN